MAGSMTDEGHTDEEWKLVNETRKILERDDIAVEPTCVRVPVMVGHGISATMWFDSPVDPDTARRVLEDAPGWQCGPMTVWPLPGLGRVRPGPRFTHPRNTREAWWDQPMGGGRQPP